MSNCTQCGLNSGVEATSKLMSRVINEDPLTKRTTYGSWTVVGDYCERHASEHERLRLKDGRHETKIEPLSIGKERKG
ncbi:hypothetical protein KKE34_03630 [Patescibacteria group bacterium]|nr:hypothetical protein [Patescibacteria group bacterium]MBU1885671.1 hypothetical protein [Patescibacteria group bacterium]